MSSLELFTTSEQDLRQCLGPATVLLRGFALPHVDALLPAIARIEAASPFRHMQTPGGFAMAVALTNCGALGWISDRRGYRYVATDPNSGQRWPPMPEAFARLATAAAAAAGFAQFEPDACLVNRYVPGTRLSLHQDKDEPDLRAPIVSVSLGLPAVFQFGGLRRNDPLKRLMLEHGDVVVWGREARLFYHGIQPLKPGVHPLTGEYRFNLTFRQAGESK